MAKTSIKPDEKPTKADKQAVKTALKALGIKQADLDAVLTTADENNPALTARDVETKLTAWCRGLKKA